MTLPINTVRGTSAASDHIQVTAHPETAGPAQLGISLPVVSTRSFSENRDETRGLS